MKRSRVLVAAVTAGVVAVAIAACADLQDASSFTGGGSDASPDGNSDPNTFGDGGATAPASGVLLVHAAAFPAFRLCFENYPDVLPQPDAKVMPQANVVGVEMGGVARIGAMPRAPGTVYVVLQQLAQATSSSAADKPCRELITKSEKNISYFAAGRVEAPIGVGRAELLVVSGCGPKARLDQIGVPISDCPGYDIEAGTGGQMRSLVFPLETTTTSTQQTLPVQLVSVSSDLEKQRPANQVLDVTFGDLDASAGQPLAQRVASAVEPYDASAGTVLQVDQTVESVFATHGFRIAYRPADGGTSAPDAASPEGFSVDQTLAQVQEVSRFDANPTTYFVTPSNYALLLLGDPRMRRTFVDGGANPDFDARRAVHLLAVPVRDELDAGPLGGDFDAGPTLSDAGTR